MSLGGAIAAATLDRFNGYELKDGRVIGKDVKFGAYIAEKTFTRTGDFILGQLEREVQEKPVRTLALNIASWILKQILSFLKWDFDTVEIWDKLPVHEKFAFNMQEDQVIKGIAGLATEVKEDGKVFVVSNKNPSAQVSLKNGNCMKVDIDSWHNSSLGKKSYCDFLNAVAKCR
jgi:hypothetical protein